MINLHYSFCQVLWFAPEADPEEHNWYGNISCTISVQKLMSYFDVNFYYIDSIDTDTHMSTRILLTKNDYDGNLEEIDVHDDGSPIKKSHWRYATSCRDADGRMVPHELEIAIEVTGNDCKWLYKNCHYAVNDHSSANTMRRNRFRSHICHKYNHFGMTCPFPFNINKAMVSARDWYPNLFN